MDSEPEGQAWRDNHDHSKEETKGGLDRDAIRVTEIEVVKPDHDAQGNHRETFFEPRQKRSVIEGLTEATASSIRS